MHIQRVIDEINELSTPEALGSFICDQMNVLVGCDGCPFFQFCGSFGAKGNGATKWLEMTMQEFEERREENG